MNLLRKKLFKLKETQSEFILNDINTNHVNSIIFKQKKNIEPLTFYKLIFLFIFSFSFLFIFLTNKNITALQNISLFFQLLTVNLILFIFLFFGRKLYYLKKRLFFFICFFLTFIILLIVFGTNNLFIYFIGFELSLIPISILIWSFGEGREAIKSAFYLLLFTFITSFFTLLGLTYFLAVTSINPWEYTDFLLIFNTELVPSEQIFFLSCLLITFLAKIPTMPLHFWLPKTYALAPAEITIFLSGILSKLGIYGIIYFFIPYFIIYTNIFIPILFTFTLFTIMTSSWIACFQQNIKKLLAYTSLGHMNIALLSFLTLTAIGIQGALYFFFLHAFINLLLFGFIGFLYEHSKTIYIKRLGGLILILPLFGFFFSFAILANLGFPGTGNFLAEFFCLLAIFQKNWILGIGICFSLLFTTISMLWLLLQLIFGTYMPIFSFFKNFSYFPFTSEKFMVVFFTFSLILLLGLQYNFFEQICKPFILSFDIFLINI